MIFPLILALCSLASPISNQFKALNFLLIIFIFLRPIRRKEILIFLVSNLIFIGSDIGAIQGGFFQFTHPDILGLPYWELFAWGFWILYAVSRLPNHFPSNVDLRALILGIIFAQSFGLIQNKELLLAVSSLLIIISLLIFHKVHDFLYLGFFAIIGISVEVTGLYFDLWTYPAAGKVLACIQFVIMWIGVGLYYRNLIGPFMERKIAPDSIFRNYFSLSSQLPTIEKPLHGEKGLSYNFTQYLEMADSALKQSNSRRSIESLREALHSARNPMERAKAHLLLSRNYRMIIQMRNARKEINHAFLELNLEIPRNYFLQTFKLGLFFIKDYFFQKNKTEIVTNEEKEIAKLKSAMLVEMGLSGYYLKKDALMLQASFGTYRQAKKLGSSLEMIDWIGGTICILTLKGGKKWIPKLKEQAEKILTELNDPQILAKWNIWMALSLDYSGNFKEAIELFTEVVENQRPYLAVQDLRLSALTLCCSYLMRGHFEKSAQAVEYLFEQTETTECSYFSGTRPFVEWYKIGAQSFLQSKEMQSDQLKTSSAIFGQQDNEKWAITQYLGNLLFYHYNNGSEDHKSINEIEERFSAIKLSPQDTYIEAAFFWIALTLVRLEQFSKKQNNEYDIKRLMTMIKKMPNHPIIRQYVKILEDRYAILVSSHNSFYINENFTKELLDSENLLGAMENRRNQIFFELKKQHLINKETINLYQSDIMKTGWKQYISMNNNWLNQAQI